MKDPNARILRLERECAKLTTLLVGLNDSWGRQIRATRLELDLLAVVIRKELNVSAEKMDDYRMQVLAMHAELEAATYVGDALAAFGAGLPAGLLPVSDLPSGTPAAAASGAMADCPPPLAPEAPAAEAAP